MATVHTRASSEGRVLMACLAALAFATTAHAAQATVTSIDTLRTAMLDATIDQIVLTAHLTMVDGYARNESKFGDTPTLVVTPMPLVNRDLAIWGNCTDPLPSWTTDLNIPPDYVRPNACGFTVIDSFNNSKYADAIFLVSGTFKFWVSNMVMRTPKNSSLFMVANAFTATGGSMLMADMVISGGQQNSNLKGFGLYTLDAASTYVADSAFLAGGASAYFVSTTESYIGTGTNIISGNLFSNATWDSFTPVQCNSLVSPSGFVTYAIYNNRIEGDILNTTCGGMCISQISSAISTYTDASAVTSFCGYASPAAATLDATILATVQPQADMATWLTTLAQISVPGASKALNPSLVAASPPPSPDKVITDAPPPAVKSAGVLAAANAILALAAAALVLV